MQDNHFNFEDVKVYRKSIAFMDTVYRTTASFPGDQRCNIGSQFRQATVSLSISIAQGTGAAERVNIRCLDTIARLLKECTVCTTAALHRAYINQAQHDALRADIIELRKMMCGLIAYLKHSAN